APRRASTGAGTSAGTVSMRWAHPSGLPVGPDISTTVRLPDVAARWASILATPLAAGVAPGSLFRYTSLGAAGDAEDPGEGDRPAAGPSGTYGADRPVGLAGHRFHPAAVGGPRPTERPGWPPRTRAPRAACCAAWCTTRSPTPSAGLPAPPACSPPPPILPRSGRCSWTAAGTPGGGCSPRP